MSGRVGRYNGIDYRQQRVCDVLAVDYQARWYFVYIDGQPTGDHYRTLAELKVSVDSGYFSG